MTIHTDPPELTGAIRCILRDIGRETSTPLDQLPGRFDTSETASILGLTNKRTLDTWASRPGHGGLPFVKVGRHRCYLLTDVVTFIAERRVDIQQNTVSAISSAVCNEVDRLSTSGSSQLTTDGISG